MATSTKLVVLCDGSWCGREKYTKSNIQLLAKMIGVDLDHEPYILEDAARNIKARYFDEVDRGSTFMDYTYNMAIATDIKEQCETTYEYIVNNYTPNDEIWMFGFSVGSYIIRCVAGMINNCGILRLKDDPNETRLLCRTVYQKYRSRLPVDAPWSPEMKHFRHLESWRVGTPVKFMGVLDTVGKLGIPQPKLDDWVESFLDHCDLFKQEQDTSVWSKSLRFHNRNISSVVENVYHAVSMHDRLGILEPCLTMKDTTKHSGVDPPYIHQKWFPGTHYDIGRQGFSFLREILRDFVPPSLPNWRNGTAEPNIVLSDLVLEWILECVKSQSGAQIIPDIDTEISLLSSENTTGSGDIYAKNTKDDTLVAQIVSACKRYLLLSLSELCNHFAIIFILMGTITSRLRLLRWSLKYPLQVFNEIWGCFLKLKILLDVRDRKISDMTADTYHYMQPDPKLNNASVRYLAAMSRYPSMTYESFQRELFDAGKLDETAFKELRMWVSKQIRTIYWKVPEFYRQLNDKNNTSDDVFDDVLTITRTSTESHSFIALTVAEFLKEYYPHFGEDLLRLVTRLCQILPVPADHRWPSSYVNLITGPSITSADFPTASVSVTTISDGTVLSFTVSTSSDEHTQQVYSAISWLVSVLQPRENQAVGLFQARSKSHDRTIGPPEIKPFTIQRNETHCWEKLFEYACIAECPPYVQFSNPEGLEIDFDLLISLAAVRNRRVVKEGVILFGPKTAIIPAGGERRWHVLDTDEVRLPKLLQSAHEYLRHRPGSTASPSEFGELPTGKVFVGWCEKPLVRIGTTEPADLLQSGVSPHPGLNQVNGQNVGYQWSGQLAIGILGPQVGFGVVKSSARTFKPGSVVGKGSTPKYYIELLTQASERPCIIWDNSVKRAWLLPAVSVLLFGVLCHIHAHGYIFAQGSEFPSLSAPDTEARQLTSKYLISGAWSMIAAIIKSREPRRNTQQRPASSNGTSALKYAQPSDNAKKSAFDCLRDNFPLEAIASKGIALPEGQRRKFCDIVTDIWTGMQAGEDICYNQNSPTMQGNANELLGYDLFKVIYSLPLHIRTINVDAVSNYSPNLRSWCRIARELRLQIVFCGRVGPVIECSAPDCQPSCSMVCHRHVAAQGTLSCFLRDLKHFYGFDRWQSPESLPIGHNSRWIPSGNKCLSHSRSGPGQSDGPCVCCADLNRLQEIVQASNSRQTSSLSRKLRDFLGRLIGDRPMQREISEWLNGKSLEGSGAVRFGRRSGNTDDHLVTQPANH
ncbi:hypothetical protein V1522DRAFT_447684 [Lipomyces starkeyi]